MRQLFQRGIPALLILGVAACQQRDTEACDVRGVWSLDSVFIDGTPQPRAGAKQMKVIANGHYSWVSQDSGAKTLATIADSLAAYRTRASGGGTYTVTDSTYVERLDYFYDPRHVGREVAITCRIANGRWEHEFDWSLEEKGVARTARIREIWHRIE